MPEYSPSKSAWQSTSFILALSPTIYLEDFAKARPNITVTARGYVQGVDADGVRYWPKYPYVKIYLDGVYVAEGNGDVNGGFAIDFTTPSAEGIYTVRADFIEGTYEVTGEVLDGYPASLYLYGSSASKSLRSLLLVATILSIALDKTQVLPGRALLITGYLTTDAGVALGGYDVRIWERFGATSGILTTVKTASDGKYSYSRSFTAADLQGLYDYQAEFLGIETFAGSLSAWSPMVNLTEVGWAWIGLGEILIGTLGIILVKVR